ncbi:MAG: hypothetical protein RH951_07180 [Parvibaculum sp.]
MSSIVLVLVVGCGVVVVTAAITIYYRRRSFKSRGLVRPKLDFFPKYEVEFVCSSDAIRQSLVSLKFDPSGEDPDRFSRGRIYGDFSAKAIKWHVQIDPDRSALKVCAQWVILFDTGDTWQLIEDILSTAREKASQEEVSALRH